MTVGNFFCEVIAIPKLPKRTNAQKIGESSADVFSATFTEFCTVIPVPQSRDLGIDFVCEVMDEEYPTGIVFNVQCKSKDEICPQSETFSAQIQVTTINYWLIQNRPTLLFIYDRQEQKFFWCFPQAFISSVNKDWQSQKTTSNSTIK